MHAVKGWRSTPGTWRKLPPPPMSRARSEKTSLERYAISFDSQICGRATIRREYGEAHSVELRRV